MPNAARSTSAADLTGGASSTRTSRAAPGGLLTPGTIRRCAARSGRCTASSCGLAEHDDRAVRRARLNASSPQVEPSTPETLFTFSSPSQAGHVDTPAVRLASSLPHAPMHVAARRHTGEACANPSQRSNQKSIHF